MARKHRQCATCGAGLVGGVCPEMANDQLLPATDGGVSEIAARGAGEGSRVAYLKERTDALHCRLVEVEAALTSIPYDIFWSVLEQEEDPEAAFEEFVIVSQVQVLRALEIEI